MAYFIGEIIGVILAILFFVSPIFLIVLIILRLKRKKKNKSLRIVNRCIAVCTILFAISIACVIIFIPDYKNHETSLSESEDTSNQKKDTTETITEEVTESTTEETTTATMEATTEVTTSETQATTETHESKPQANTSEMVDYIARKAKSDSIDATETEIQRAIKYIRKHYPNYFSNNKVMEKSMYYGYYLEYANYDSTTTELGMDTYQAIKYVYRGAEKTTDQHVTENLRQIKKSLNNL